MHQEAAAKIKICKVRDLATAHFCARLGVDFVGLHLIDKCDADKIQTFHQISNLLQGTATRPVLVTKITSTKDLSSALINTGIRWVQLHARLAIEKLERIQRDVQTKVGEPIVWIGVAGIEEKDTREYLENLRNSGLCQYYLLDSSWRGGTGKTAPQALVAECLEVLPRHRTFIAGGIDLTNARSMVQQFKPFALDVQSATELQSGLNGKDPISIISLLQTQTEFNPRTALSSCGRTLISASLSEVQQQQQLDFLQSLAQVPIDGIHADYSDGSMTPQFIVDPVDMLLNLRAVAPCIPYDTHMFLKSVNSINEALPRCLAANPLLRTVFIHLQGLHDANLRVGMAAEILQKTPARLGIAIQAASINASELRSWLKSNRHLPIKEFSIVLHSARHPISMLEKCDLQLVRVLKSYAEELGGCHIAVDRDVNFERLNLLSLAGPTHAVVGQVLLGSPSKKDFVSQLRKMLMPPLPHLEPYHDKYSLIADTAR